MFRKEYANGFSTRDEELKLLYDYLNNPEIDRFALKYYLNHKHPFVTFGKGDDKSTDKEGVSLSPSFNKKFENLLKIDEQSRNTNGVDAAHTSYSGSSGIMHSEFIRRDSDNEEIISPPRGGGGGVDIITGANYQNF